MILAELVDGPAHGGRDGLACTPVLVPGRDERDPPSPSGGRARAVDPRAALAPHRNEPGDDGSPAAAAVGGAVNQFRQVH